MGILHHNRVGGDFIKLSACHLSLNIEIGKVERLINFMDILCLSVYFEDGRNLKIYLLCKVSSINSLVSKPSPAIHTTGNKIDLNNKKDKSKTKIVNLISGRKLQLKFSATHYEAPLVENYDFH